MVYEYDHFTETERRGKLLKDTHPDEHATCYIVQGRGLVVISSCGHVGLINTIKQAMAVSGVSKLHAVIGGFHLVTAPPEYIERTVTELADARARRRPPDALLRRGLHRRDAPAHAGTAGDDQRRHAVYVWGVSGRSACDRQTCSAAATAFGETKGFQVNDAWRCQKTTVSKSARRTEKPGRAKE